MSPATRTLRSGRRVSRRGPSRGRSLYLEPLETRTLLTATSWQGLANPVLAVEPNESPSQAQDLGSLSQKPRAEVIGTISNTDGVDWFRFSLTQTARVKLSTLDQQAGSPLVSDLSLYVPDASDPSGYRLIAQNDGALNGGDAQLDAAIKHLEAAIAKDPRPVPAPPEYPDKSFKYP